MKTFTALPFSIERIPLTVVVPDPKVTDPVLASVRLLKVVPPLIKGVLPFKTTVPIPGRKVPLVLVRFPPTFKVFETAGSEVKLPELYQLPITVSEFGPLMASLAPD